MTRTYLTRHGAGPFPTECPKKEINAEMIDKTNVPNPHQGTLRYGHLDQKALQRRVRKDFGQNKNWKLSLAVTHLNEYGVIPRIGNAFQKVYFSDGETRENVRRKENA